jgi:hypothetical protein
MAPKNGRDEFSRRSDWESRMVAKTGYPSATRGPKFAQAANASDKTARLRKLGRRAKRTASSDTAVTPSESQKSGPGENAGSTQTSVLSPAARVASRMSHCLVFQAVLLKRWSTA